MINYYSPATGSPLKTEGDFLFDDKNNKYPIINSIPRFVPQANYADAFGFQWNKFQKTQLDSFSGAPITENRLKRCMENAWEDLKDREVLECGCGAGRFTEILLNKGAYVHSIDLSSAVDANQTNFPQSDKHRIAQASILELPFDKEKFDFVVCLGVLQHTPNPTIAIHKLYEMVKPGGWLVIDHYAPTLSMLTKIGLIASRPFIKRMKPEKAFVVVKKLVDFFFPFHKMVRRFYLGQIVLSRISPIATYFHAYPELSDDLQYEWALLDTYDSLTDQYKHLLNLDSIKKIMLSLHVSDLQCRKGGNGIEATGQKPKIDIELN